MATVARTSGTVLRTAVALAGAALVLAAAPSVALAPAVPVLVPVVAGPGYDAAGTARLYSLVNAHRAKAGHRALTIHSSLTTIAEGHTARMAATGQCVHNDALFTRAAHTATGIKTFGENVALNDTLDGAHAALLKSPPHRANIENGAFVVAGFAVVVDVKGLVWVTQDFGTAPRAAAPVAAPRVLPAPRAVTPPVPRTPVAPRVRPATRPAARPALAKAAKPAKATAATQPLARPAARKDGDAGSATTAAAPVAAVPGSAPALGSVAANGTGRAAWPVALAVALLVLAGLGVVTAPRRAVPARLGA